MVDSRLMNGKGGERIKHGSVCMWPSDLVAATSSTASGSERKHTSEPLVVLGIGGILNTYLVSEPTAMLTARGEDGTKQICCANVQIMIASW